MRILNVGLPIAWLIAVVVQTSIGGQTLPTVTFSVLLALFVCSIATITIISGCRIQNASFNWVCQSLLVKIVLRTAVACACFAVSSEHAISAEDPWFGGSTAAFAMAASYAAISTTPYIFSAFVWRNCGRYFMVDVLPTVVGGIVGIVVASITEEGTPSARDAVISSIVCHSIAASLVVFAAAYARVHVPGHQAPLRGSMKVQPQAAAQYELGIAENVAPHQSKRTTPVSSDNDDAVGAVDAASTASKASSLQSVLRPVTKLPGSLANSTDASASSEDDARTPVERLIRLLRPLKASLQGKQVLQHRTLVDSCLDILYNTSDLFQVDYGKLLSTPFAQKRTRQRRPSQSRVDQEQLRLDDSSDAQTSSQPGSINGGKVNAGALSSERSAFPDAVKNSINGRTYPESASTDGDSSREASKVALADENTRKWLASQLQTGAPTSGKAQVRVRKTRSSHRRQSMRSGGSRPSILNSHGSNPSSRMSAQKMQLLHSQSIVGHHQSEAYKQQGRVPGSKLRPMGSQARMVTTKMSQNSLFRAHSLHVLNKMPTVSFDIPGMGIVDGNSRGVRVPDSIKLPAELDTSDPTMPKAPRPDRYRLSMRHASMPHMKSFVVQMPLVRESSEENMLARRESKGSMQSFDSKDNEAQEAKKASAPVGSSQPAGSKPEQGDKHESIAVSQQRSQSPEGPGLSKRLSESPVLMMRAVSAADVFEELKSQSSSQDFNGGGYVAENVRSEREASRRSRSGSEAARMQDIRIQNELIELTSRSASRDDVSSPHAGVLARSTRSNGSTSARGTHAVELPQYTYIDVAPMNPSLVIRLQSSLRWDFDVFALQEESDQRPLAMLGNNLFQRFGCIEQYGLPEPQLTAFLNTMEHHYCYDPDRRNPYHCSTHAADGESPAFISPACQPSTLALQLCMYPELTRAFSNFSTFAVAQGVAHFLTTDRIKSVANELDKFALLLAAMVHDFRHPGCNNAYLVKSSHDLALRYNDESVLECHHVSEGFQLLHQPRFDIMCQLEDEERRRVRYVAIQAVRVTDLAVGARLVNTFKSKLATTVSLGKTSEEDRQLVLNMVLKCSDVSHPARPLKAHLLWTDLITEEFYRQGDFERRLGLSMSPLCDRADHNLPKSQLGFIQFVVRPSYAVFAEYLGTNEHLEQLDRNVEFWQKEAQAGDPAEKRQMTDITITRRSDEDLYRGPGPYMPLTHCPLQASEVEAHREASDQTDADSFLSFDGGKAGGAGAEQDDGAERMREPGQGGRRASTAVAREATSSMDEDDDEEVGEVVMVSHEGQIDEILSRHSDSFAARAKDMDTTHGARQSDLEAVQAAHGIVAHRGAQRRSPSPEPPVGGITFQATSMSSVRSSLIRQQQQQHQDNEDGQQQGTSRSVGSGSASGSRSTTPTVVRVGQ